MGYKVRKHIFRRVRILAKEDSNIPDADNEDSDQTARMCRLICVFHWTQLLRLIYIMNLMICVTNLTIYVHLGILKAVLTIEGAHNVDWEDIACKSCHDGNDCYVYVADTGGNTGRDANTVYRIKEPEQIQTQTLPVDSTLKFRYKLDVEMHNKFLLQNRIQLYDQYDLPRLRLTICAI